MVPDFLPSPGRKALLPWVLLALLPALLPCRAAAQQTLETGALQGPWEGEMSVDPVPLEVHLTLERDEEGWSGTFSLPAEGVEDMPLTSVEVEDDSVVVRITPRRVVHGTAQNGVIEGRLVFEDRGGETAGIRLVRVDGPAWDAFLEERAAREAERDSTLDAAAPPPLERTGGEPEVGRVDEAALQRLVASARASHSAALVVLRGGELIGSWHAGGERRPIEAMSVTKSVLNLAVGRLVTLGLLDSLDTPVHEFYPEWSDGPYSEITVRHLLNHTSGLESPMPTGPIYASDDFVRYALESDLVAQPGQEMVYNNNATNLLAGLVGEVAGLRLDRFLGEELFSPMGIKDFSWSLDDAGNPHGMAGLQIRPEDLAHLGQLVLQRGEWEGEQLIAEEWFDRSLVPGSEHSDDVGLLWWLVRDGERVVGARAEGYLGQHLVIFPEDRLVAVRMVESFPGYDPERDGFADFQELVGELVR